MPGKGNAFVVVKCGQLAQILASLGVPNAEESEVAALFLLNRKLNHFLFLGVPLGACSPPRESCSLGFLFAVTLKERFLQGRSGFKLIIAVCMFSLKDHEKS